jgi:hypothetical protein
MNTLQQSNSGGHQFHAAAAAHSCMACTVIPGGGGPPAGLAPPAPPAERSGVPVLGGELALFQGNSCRLVTIANSNGPAVESELLKQCAREEGAGGGGDGADRVTFTGTDSVLGRSSWHAMWLSCTDNRPLASHQHLTAINLVADRTRVAATEPGSGRRLKAAGGSGGFVRLYSPIVNSDGAAVCEDVSQMLNNCYISVNNEPFLPVSGDTLKRIDALWHVQPAVSVRIKHTACTKKIVKLRFTVSNSLSRQDVVLHAAGMVVLGNPRKLYGGAICKPAPASRPPALEPPTALQQAAAAPLEWQGELTLRIAETEARIRALQAAAAPVEWQRELPLRIAETQAQIRELQAAAAPLEWRTKRDCSGGPPAASNKRRCLSLGPLPPR